MKKLALLASLAFTSQYAFAQSRPGLSANRAIRYGRAGDLRHRVAKRVVDAGEIRPGQHVWPTN